MSAGRGRWLKRALIALLLLCAAVLLSFGWIVDRLATGFPAGPPQTLAGRASPATLSFIERVLAGVDPARTFDFHVHVVGRGTDASGCWVNPRFSSPLYPADWVRYRFYVAAAGVADPEHADRQYAARLEELARHSPLASRYGLLAMDWRYGPDGVSDRGGTELYVPGEWVETLAGGAPDLFVPIGSVNPWGPDALAELDRLAARGVRIVKWLPNAMGIDPADERCDPFYDRMVELGLVLLSHAGVEMAVALEEDQELGNPLRLRRALDRGVPVVVAHCASLGELEDTDDPAGGTVPSFDLFLRLMDEPRYRGLVWGELSSVTLVNRPPQVLERLLARTDLHPRLVNGSDYPVSAIRVLVHLRKLEQRGFLSNADRRALSEIHRFNPLFFDFALKRALRHPQTGLGFPVTVFEAPAELGLL